MSTTPVNKRSPGLPRRNLMPALQTAGSFSECWFGVGLEYVATLNNAGGATVVLQQRDASDETAIWADIGETAQSSEVFTMLFQANMVYRVAVLAQGTIPASYQMRKKVPASIEDRPGLHTNVPYSNGFTGVTSQDSPFLKSLTASELIMRWSETRAARGEYIPGVTQVYGSDGLIYLLNPDRGGGSPGLPGMNPVDGNGSNTSSWIRQSFSTTPLTIQYRDGAAPDAGDAPSGDDVPTGSLAVLGAYLTRHFTDFSVSWQFQESGWIQIGRVPVGSTNELPSNAATKQELDDLHEHLRGAGAANETLGSLRDSLNNLNNVGGGATAADVQQIVATAIAGADFDKRIDDVPLSATTFPAGEKNEWFYIDGDATLDGVVVTKGVYRSTADGTLESTPANWNRDEVLSAVATPSTVTPQDLVDLESNIQGSPANNDTLASLRAAINAIVNAGGGQTAAQVQAAVGAAIAGADFDKRIDDVPISATTFPAAEKNEWFFIAGDATLDGVAVTEGVYRSTTDGTVAGTPANWVRDEVLSAVAAVPGITQQDLDQLASDIKGSPTNTDTLTTLRAAIDAVVAAGTGQTAAEVQQAVSAAIAGADFDKRIDDVPVAATTFPAGDKNEWFYISGDATLDGVAVTEGVYRSTADGTAAGTPANWNRDEVLSAVAITPGVTQNDLAILESGIRGSVNNNDTLTSLRASINAVVFAGNGAPPWINAVDFGADRNGATNSTDAILDAIHQVQPAEGTPFQQQQRGGKVILPEGTYLVDDILARKNVHLMGAGPGTILVQANGTNSPVISPEGAEEFPFQITDMRIRGTNLPSDGGTNAYGILLNTLTSGGFTVPDGQHIIERVWIERAYNDCIRVTNSCRGNTLTNIWAKGSIIGSGLYIDGSDNVLDKIVSRGHAKSGYEVHAGNTRIANAKAFFCRETGFVINSPRANLSQCEAQDNFEYGFRIMREDTTIAGGVADTNQHAGFFIDLQGGQRAGINLTGIHTSGKPEEQESKPFIGQNVGVLVGPGTLRDSLINGISRNNNNANYLVEGQANSVNVTGLVLGT